MATIKFNPIWDAHAFDLIASDPTSWHESAKANRRAAKLLADAVSADWTAMERYIAALGAASPEERPKVKATEPDEPKLDGPALFLYALAIENLLKGILVAANPVEGGKLPESVKGHDLVNLARAAKLELSAKDRDVLAFITRCGTSWGRYPVALTASKMEGSYGYNWTELIAHLEEIYQRFAEALVKVSRARFTAE